MGKFKFKRTIAIKEEEGIGEQEKSAENSENAANNQAGPTSPELQALYTQKTQIKNAISELNKQIEQKNGLIYQLDLQIVKAGGTI